jgi:hypothetical protein
MQSQLSDSMNTTAESTGEAWRLFLKALIKTGLSLGRNVQAIGQTVYSEASKVVAEAKAELDRDAKAKAAGDESGAPN